MTESSSFSSLMALVDSHLSKTNVQESHSDKGNCANRIPLPSLNDGPSGTLSDTLLSFPPSQSFSLGASPDSSIKSILAKQVENMLKAKALKGQKEEEEKERQRLEAEMKKMKIEEDDCVIDLMKALQTSCPVKSASQDEIVSSSSSYESLFEPKFIDCDEIPIIPKTPVPLLPCTTDMLHILKQKVGKAKCSPFGKVLTSRLRPVAAPYLFTNSESSIKRFNFSTQSPCDIIKEKLRRPTYSSCNNDFKPIIFSDVPL